MYKKPFKIAPHIHTKNGEKCYKIVDQKDREYYYNGTHFRVWSKYQDTEDVCDHLNGEGKVWGIVTKNNWELFKDFMRCYR